MQIKTAEGWVNIKGRADSIANPPQPMTQMQAETIVLRDRFCGWTPTSRGPLSAQNVSDFHKRVSDMASVLAAEHNRQFA